MGRRRSRAIRAARPALVVLVAAGALLLASCSDPAPEIPLGPDGEPDAVLSLGRDVWTSYCSSCHGARGQGGRGKKLADGQVFVLHPEAETMVAVIGEGKGRGMPGFADELSAAEIEAVTRYIREVLN